MNPAVIVFACALAGPASGAPDATSTGVQAAPTAPEAPGASVPRLTETEYLAQCAAYERSRSVAAYRALHADAPSEHEDLELALIEAASSAFAGDGAWGDVKTLATDRRLGGSTDPLVAQLVRYYTGAVLEPAEMPAYYTGLIERLREGGYPPMRIGGAAMTGLASAQKNGLGEFGEEVARVGIAEGIKAASEPGLTSCERRYVYDKFFAEALDGWDREWREWVCAEVSRGEGVDPWIRELVLGTSAIKRAWEERSDELAYKVTDEQFRRFNKDLHAAEEHLTSAWRADPACPEPAAAMITVVMGVGEDDQHDLRAWFRRATAAQVDYAPAYSKLRYALEPKWGGSAPELAQMVLELDDPKYLGTNAAFEAVRFLQAAQAAWGHDEQEGRAYRDPRLSEVALTLLGSVADNPGRTDYVRDRARSWMTVLWYRLDDFERAAGALRSITGVFDGNVQIEADLTGTDIPSLVLPRLVPAEGEVRAAEALERRASWSDAAGRWSAVLDGLPEGTASDVRGAVEHRRVVAQMNADFATGEWVDVVFAPGLPGLVPRGGEWTAGRDGAVTAHAADNTILYIPIHTGDRFVLEATVEVPENVRSHTRVGLVFGAGTRRTDRFAMHRNASIWVSEHRAVTAWYWTYKAYGVDVDADARSFTLRVVEDGDHILTTIDGKKIANGTVPNWKPESEPEEHMIGIGGWYMMVGHPDADAVFRGVRVRRVREGDFPPDYDIEF